MQSPGEQKWDCLQDMLKSRAKLSPARHLLFYPLGHTSLTPERVSYRTLYDEAVKKSKNLEALDSFREFNPVLLHLEDHWDTIQWFWAVLLAQGIPILSSPLSNVEDHRNKHLENLSRVLDSPICITRASSQHLFEGSNHTLEVHTVESLRSVRLASRNSHADLPILPNPKSDGTVHELNDNKGPPAVLMLTSGSTGNAKAVRLTHKQIFTAVSGKASVRPLPQDGAFLNWIGLDHVASLIEIHIQAMWLGVSQVHAHAADIVASPRRFLDLLSQHRVSRSFAPNFFLAKLVSSCDNDSTQPGEWDLSTLTVLASGGEANDIRTCVAASELLMRYGARRNVITPGFGMTETCAGSIFNLNCPDSDISKGRTVASLGRCMRGIEMRIMDSNTGQIAAPGSLGDLEVCGDAVFDGYYRNPDATSKSFTADGWFRTGDQGIIDTDGNLNLTGRVKDIININGNKIVTSDVQVALEKTLRNTCVARVVSFPSRAPGAETEQVTVAYVPKEWPPQPKDVAEVDRLTHQACMMVSAACRPFIISIGPKSITSLPISALGKISGAKMRELFEAGVFGDDAAYHRETVRGTRDRLQTQTDIGVNETEALIRADFAWVRGIKQPEAIKIDTPVFELGFTSMDVIRLKHRIDTRLGINLATIVIIKHYTIRLLAAALRGLIDSSPRVSDPEPSGGAETEYDPIVVLRSTGTKTPLWLVHPGVGEVLVFIGLAQHMSIDNRSIYALRARGFEPNQANFASISEAMDMYFDAIRRQQPQGPYALAGYSYGTMLAFEIAKKLESAGEEVRFLGSFNLPPHIKTRMRQLNWNMCLLHLAQFLSLITDECAYKESSSNDSSFRNVSRNEALARVLQLADNSRMQELGLQPPGLTRWADVAYGLQSMAVDYEPSGSVQVIDIFHAEPLKIAAASRQEWVNERLSRWRDFCITNPRYHEVEGAHYTMISPQHVESFSKKLQAALAAREL
ncbi:acetyl-CoA synthetase-like protein [Annulohypoxylon moriforme]|nr:acetyl-CoA synthetase-like protein [Annulohypoxylon moriforme]